MIKSNTHIYAWFCIVLLHVPLMSQVNLETQLANIVNSGYDETYIKEYTGPLAKALGVSMAGAQYHRASTKGFPRFDAGISSVYLMVPDNQRKFLYQGEEVPTFFGPSSSQNNVLGTNLDGFFLHQLQLNVGLFANLELMARGLQTNVSEIGDIDMLGFGVKYGLSDLIPIPIFPIDLSIQALYQTLSVNEWLNSGTFGMNVNASKDLVVLPISLYMGVGYETTTIIIQTSNLPDVSQSEIGDVSINTDNFRLNFGVSWTLMILNLHADYNIGEFNSIAAGVMIVL